MDDNKKTYIDKEFFKFYIKTRRYTIKSLGELGICTEKTIQRALKNGFMTTKKFNAFCNKLGVHPKLLSGEAYLGFKKTFDFSPQEFMRVIDSQKFTYSKYKEEKMSAIGINEILEKFLGLFSISFEQFQNLDFEEQYQFQYNLIVLTEPLLKKFFKKSITGEKIEDTISKLLCDLESYKEDHYFKQFLNIDIRKKFLQKPPKGYTKKDISKMSVEKIEGLYYELEMKILNEQK